jgi:hypothetical protein
MMIDKESFAVKDAVIHVEKGPMSKSKEIDELGDFYQLSKVPESFFGQNKVRIDTPLYSLTLTAAESLAPLKHKTLEELLQGKSPSDISDITAAFRKVPFVYSNDIKVPKADDWKKSRGLHENSAITEQQLDQDWTYLNHYRGNIEPQPHTKFQIVANPGIPKERLSVENKILFYKDLFLYEDDLGDFGYSQLRLRLRVQADSIFILMRSYARVDNQQIRSIDNRIFIDLDDYSIHRDIDFFDGKYDEIEKNGFHFEPGFNVDFDQADKVTRFMRGDFKACDRVVCSKSE